MSDRIRVLWLIKGLGLGGAEILLARAVRHFDRERFDIEIAYVLPWKNALVDQLERDGVRVHCLGARRALDPRWLWRLARLVRAGRFDVIEMHSPVPAAAARLLTRLLPVGRRPRLVYTEHNTWDRYHRLTAWVNALTFGLNDHAFVVSDAVRASVRPRFPVRRITPRPEVLHEGIDFEHVVRRNGHAPLRDEFGIQDGVPVVGTIANLKAHKGLDRLARIARLVADEVPDVRFVVVGTGPEERTLIDRTQREGVADRFVLTGFRHDALDIAQRFDVFALPSTAEGFPISVLEAMALERPVVATAVGGLPEAIQHDVHGYLVQPGEDQVLAKHIVDVLRDQDLATRLGRAARVRVQTFDNVAAARRRAAAYEELMQG